MSFEEAYELMGRDEAFRATVYAMNTLLTDKGIYTAEEFQNLFIEYGINIKRRRETSSNGAGAPSQTVRAGS